MSKSIKPTERTSLGLRNVMFEILDGVRSGEITPQAASAAARTGGVIMASARLEMDHHRFVSTGLLKADQGKSALTGLKLGE